MGCGGIIRSLASLSIIKPEKSCRTLHAPCVIYHFILFNQPFKSNDEHVLFLTNLRKWSALGKAFPKKPIIYIHVSIMSLEVVSEKWSVVKIESVGTQSFCFKSWDRCDYLFSFLYTEIHMMINAMVFRVIRIQKFYSWS